MYVSWNHLKSSLLKKNMLSRIKELTDDTAAFQKKKKKNR